MLPSFVAVLLLPLAPAQLPDALPVARVTDRSEPVRVALQAATGKDRAAITAEDLAKVTDLKLPHIHIPAFKDDDFAGLMNLKKLHFYSLVHSRGRPNDPVTLRAKVFADLTNLEELIINDQLGLLPDDVFSPLKSLKVLDLSNSTLPRLPRSMLTLPKIETVYFDGRGMSPQEFETLKTALGNKHKTKREKK